MSNAHLAPDPDTAWTLDTLKAYFEAILREQRLAMDMATVEREKAAQILRDGLLHQIESGDHALEHHIQEQVRQIRTIIEMGSAQVQAAFDASEKAILKAETATERRFESVNEFRAQLASQTASFMPREVAEARFDQHAARIAELDKKASAAAGKSAGVSASVGLMIGASAVVISIVVVFVNVLLAN